MKNKTLTAYLTIFLLVCIICDGILLCCFSSKPWWNNWMIIAPNLFMILGAFYCPFMMKNVQADPHKLTWILVYKGIKMLITVAAMALYIAFVKRGSKIFLIITASAYLVALIVETGIFAHFMKKQNLHKT